MSSGKPSGVETTKRESRFLRGTIAEELAAGGTQVSEAAYGLLKFHGTYEQYDRDTATERKQKGLEKEYQFMVRARIPGGRVMADQWLALDALADLYANGTLRITTRQGIQFHGVLKGDLKASIAGINDTLLTTFAACGDVARNVMTTPAPVRDAVHARLEADATLLSAHLLPKTRAYHELFLDGEPVTAPEEEPLYGPTYLPRKFKIALATPEDNSVDVLTNDLGIVALFEGERLQGYNLCLGGGLGMTHNKPETYPRLATPIAFVGSDDLVRGVEAVTRLYRDHGDRTNRKHARLKYVVEEKGVAWTRAALEAAYGGPLTDPRPMPRFRVRDPLGWHPHGDGRWWLGVPVASGRVADTDAVRLRTALRILFGTLVPNAVLTAQQDVLLCDIREDERDEVVRILRAHGVTLAEDLTPVARWALACPALPTCGLALSEAERVQAPMVGAIEAALERHGLLGETISVRITGCPNGCARPYAGDIGIVGRAPGLYALYVGGDFEGTRLNVKLVDKVREEDVAATLEPLFAAWAAGRDGAGEGFGDWCHRTGPAALAGLLGVREAA